MLNNHRAQLFSQCTIAIPVYNRIDFLPRVIASVQPMLDLGAKILIVDDHSKESNWEGLKQLVPPGITLERNPKNLGLFGNWQNCLEKSGRPFTLILCSDDEANADYLAKAIDLLNRHPNAHYVTSKGSIVNEQLEPIGEIANCFPEGLYDGPKNIENFLEFYALTGVNPFNYPSGILLRTERALGIGGFDTSMRHVGDLDLYFRLMLVGSFIIVKDTGTQVTFHSGQQGVIQSTDIVGVTELMQMARNLSKISQNKLEFHALNQLYLTLCLWFGLRFLKSGQFKIYKNFRDFIKSQQPHLVLLLPGIARIVVSKVYLKRHPTDHKWAKKSVVRSL